MSDRRSKEIVRVIFSFEVEQALKCTEFQRLTSFKFLLD
jgi:hypothetical protein